MIGALSDLVFSSYPVVAGLIEVLINLYLVAIALWVLDAIIDTFYMLYEESAFSTKLPLKGICQAIKIVVNVTGVIFILSILLDKSPVFFLGSGALTAVLLLVFKGCDSWISCRDQWRRTTWSAKVTGWRCQIRGGRRRHRCCFDHGQDSELG